MINATTYFRIIYKLFFFFFFHFLRSYDTFYAFIVGVKTLMINKYQMYRPQHSLDLMSLGNYRWFKHCHLCHLKISIRAEIFINSKVSKLFVI